MDYQEILKKYLKYKLKYLSAKKSLIGGAISADNMLIHYQTRAALTDAFIQSGDIHGAITTQMNFIVELATAAEANDQQREWASQSLLESQKAHS